MSSTERLANEFDLSLHRMWTRALRLADDSRIATEKQHWLDLANHLRLARTSARSMMSKFDLARTEE